MVKLVAIVGIILLAIVCTKFLVYLLPVVASPVVLGASSLAVGSIAITWAMLAGLAFTVIWWRTFAAFK